MIFHILLTVVSINLDVAYEELVTKKPYLAAVGVKDGAITKNQLASESRYLNFSGKFRGFTFKADVSDHKKGFMGPRPDLDSEKGLKTNTLASNLQANYEIELFEEVKC